MKDQIMLKSILSVVLLVIGIATVNADPYPPNENWDFLGTKNIGHHYDKDVIHVRSSRVLYSSIELRTDRPNVNLHKCVIYFSDGGEQRVDLKKDRRGGEAHFIDLYGGARAIDKIEIIGSRDYSKIFRVFDKGTVEFWGKLARNPSSYNNDRYDEYNDYDYRRDDYYNSQAQLERERVQLAREQAQRARERAQRDLELAQRDRERAQRERERAQRERDRRGRNRRGGGVCPPRGRW